MVRTWNREPSTTQSSAPLQSDTFLRERVKSAAISHTPRFARDANNTIPNFLNGYDGEHHELAAGHRAVDTNTHTTYAVDRLSPSKGAVTLVDTLTRSLCIPSSMVSACPTSPTVRSMLCNDTRYELLRNPYDNPNEKPLGPGSYDVARANPVGLGLLPVDSAQCGATPARDVLRMSSAFVSSPRPQHRFVGGGADQVYLNAEPLPPAVDHLVPFDSQICPARAEVADWRYNTRLRNMVSSQVDHSDYLTDTAGRLLDVAQMATTSNRSGVMFGSKEPRLATLPRERGNDVRLSRPRIAEDTAHLGPGTYGPSTCDNGKQQSQRSYRLFISPSAADKVLSSSFTRAMARHNTLGASADAGGTYGSATAATRSGASASFQSVNRQKKFGPHSWATDSAFTRTM